MSLDSASLDLEEFAVHVQPWKNNGVTLTAAPAAFFFQPGSGDAKEFIAISRLLTVPVMLILVIAGVNLTNLLIARNAAREHEIAIRLAIGAGRLQLIRQLCTESAMLGLVGGVGGLLVSICSASWIESTILEMVRRVSGGAWRISLDVSVDWRIFSYTAILSLLTGIVVGVWPATQLLRADIHGTMKMERSAQVRHRGVRRNSRNLLLTVQMAASLILLAGAGVLFRGAWRSLDVDPGLDTRHVFRLGVATHALAGDMDARAALFHKVAQRVAAMPDVVSVATADRLPFLGSGSDLFQTDERKSVPCLINAVSERYFETLGIPLVSGRPFTRSESESASSVVVINDVAAQALWPGKDPLGRRIFREGSTHESFVVVGVAKGVRSTYLSKVDGPYVYFPRTFSPGSLLLVRARTSPKVRISQVSAMLSLIDPKLPSQSYMGTLEDGPVEIQRLMAKVPATASSILGLLALLLSAVGIYGTVSYQVSQRVHEIGVRIALGAEPLHVICMVLRQGLRPVAWGTGIGLVGAFCFSVALTILMPLPAMPDLTFGAGAFSITTFIGVGTLLAVVVFLACVVPVRRATKIEPMVALRSE